MNARPYLAMLAVVALGMGAPAALSAGKQCYSQLVKYGSVDLTIDGEILVPVSLDGHAGLMVLNVGDGGTFVWDTFVKSERLRAVNDGPVASFMSYRISKGVKVKELKVGAMSFGTGMVAVSPPVWTGHSELPLPVIGALGMDVLGKVDFELDFAHRALNVFLHGHCPGNVVYWTDQYASLPLHRDQVGNISVSLALADKQVEAMIGIGRQRSTLDSRAAKLLYDLDFSPADANNFATLNVTAPGLSATNIRVELKHMVNLSDGCRLAVGTVTHYSSADCLGVFPMEVGLDVLQGLRMYFATEEQVLYFSAANAGK